MSEPYRNPLRDVKGLVLARTDQGVDYFSKMIWSRIYPPGKSKITRAATNSGWPGGGVIQGVLLEGPNKGEEWYVSEFIRVQTRVGWEVDTDTVIARFKYPLMTKGPLAFRGIETGWICPYTHEPCSTDTSGVATVYGKRYARFLRSLGCPTQQDPGPGSTHACAKWTLP